LRRESSLRRLTSAAASLRHPPPLCNANAARRTLPCRISCCLLLGPVYCVASFLQGIFLGKIHRRELSIPVMDRLGSSWVLDQRIIALPIAACQLMKLHFDFYAFVDSLNHALTFRCLPNGTCCKDSYRLPPEGADRSGLNDCHSRICSDTSLFSRSSFASSHRRRSSSSRASTNPARPDLRYGLLRLPYAMFGLLLF